MVGTWPAIAPVVFRATIRPWSSAACKHLAHFGPSRIDLVGLHLLDVGSGQRGLATRALTSIPGGAPGGRCELGVDLEKGAYQGVDILRVARLVVLDRRGIEQALDHLRLSGPAKGRGADHLGVH